MSAPMGVRALTQAQAPICQSCVRQCQGLAQIARFSSCSTCTQSCMLSAAMFACGTSVHLPSQMTAKPAISLMWLGWVECNDDNLAGAE